MCRNPSTIRFKIFAHDSMSLPVPLDCLVAGGGGRCEGGKSTVRFEIFAHDSMSFWNGALEWSVNGAAKLHSIEHNRIITLGLGIVLVGAGRVYWYAYSEGFEVSGRVHGRGVCVGMRAVLCGRGLGS
jgi:hypothetical protein